MSSTLPIPEPLPVSTLETTQLQIMVRDKMRRIILTRLYGGVVAGGPRSSIIIDGSRFTIQSTEHNLDTQTYQVVLEDVSPKFSKNFIHRVASLFFSYFSFAGFYFSN